MDLVLIDPVALLWHRQRLAKSKTAFADYLLVDRKVIYRIEAGQAVKRTTAMDIAKVLDVPVEELFVATPVNQSAEEAASPWNHPEWEVVPGTFSPLRVMSNGLVMRTAKVRHRVLANDFGRAKLYDIAGMSSAVRSQCHQALTRHATVCRKLAACPYVSTNLTMTALQDHSIWTAVDTWVDGVSLTELPLPEVASVMNHVASGVAALHAERILLRELHPISILREESTGLCVLTDLELAKLLEIESTVSSQWASNPFRAPEVAGGVSLPQADLYSLGRLFVRLAIGALPDYPGDADALTNILSDGSQSKSLLELAKRSLSPNWKKRPGSVTEFINVLSDWGKQHEQP
jgi:DNA-binding XRE family transcriptional regulator